MATELHWIVLDLQGHVLDELLFRTHQYLFECGGCFENLQTAGYHVGKSSFARPDRNLELVGEIAIET